MKTILIVAKVSAARAELAKRLEDSGYVVLKSNGPREAAASLKGCIPGAILIDLPIDITHRFVRTLMAQPTRTIPRLVAVRPWGTAEETMPSATGIFIRPVDPQHVIRALEAFYPGAAAQPAAARESLSVLQRDERIQEAIALMTEDPAAAGSVAIAQAVDMNESIVRTDLDHPLPQSVEPGVFVPSAERTPVELGA